jgi:adenylate cyclase
MTDPPRRTLRGLAESMGIDAEQIDKAETDGTLGLLVLDGVVVGEVGIYTQDEIVARSGLGEDARRFWRALGFPDPDPDERIFSQIDLEMLQLVDAVVRLELLDSRVALQMARVIGSSMERIAQSHVDAIEARIDASPGEIDEEAAVQRAGLLLPSIPRILEYTWRRHLQSAARRRMVQDAGAGGQRIVCVGFADLVGFTALSQQLDDAALVDVVDRFEATAYDLVGGHGGRVVKMIGDEVMFEVDSPAVAVELALELSAAYHDDESVSDVRVGVACGPVLSREGDLYGPTVNLASRIVAIAFAGSVVVSGDLREAVEGDERYRFKTLRTRYLKHIGRVQLHSVTRATDDVSEGAFERARRRRGAIRDKVAELVEHNIQGTSDAAADGDDVEPVQ